ncbi:hypothetical protein EJK15_27415 [Nonomuraea basaltis]|nr:hypothetical protein EJK15_27415 [Nonomuraea basaltis]
MSVQRPRCRRSPWSAGPRRAALPGRGPRRSPGGARPWPCPARCRARGGHRPSGAGRCARSRSPPAAGPRWLPDLRR